MGFPGICSFFSTNCPLKVEWLDPQVGLHDKEWIIDARSYCYFSTITSEWLHIVDIFTVLLMGDLLWLKCDTVWLTETFPTFAQVWLDKLIPNLLEFVVNKPFLFRHTMKETFVWIGLKTSGERWGYLNYNHMLVKARTIYLYKQKVSVLSLSCLFKIFLAVPYGQGINLCRSVMICYEKPF